MAEAAKRGGASFMDDAAHGRVYAMALAAVLLYGLTPVWTKVAIGAVDGPTVGGLRAVVALLPALAIIVARRLPLPHGGGALILLLISGGGALAGFPLLFSWGVQHTTAGHAAAGTASAAVVAGILIALIDRRWPTRAWWAGIAIGFSGAVLLVWETVGLGVEGVTLKGDLLVFAGVFTGVVGYIAGVRLTLTHGTVCATMWSVVVAAVLTLPVVLWRSGPGEWASMTGLEWFAVCSLAWGTTIAAYLLWNRALADGGIARIGALQLLQPVIGISVAVAFLGEPLTPLLVAATLVVLAGVALVQRSPR
jgi:drug/metabolite transporter (DMT)-like permease